MAKYGLASACREVKSSRKPQLEALKWLFPQNSTVEEFYQGETHISGDGKFMVRESKAIYREFEGTDTYPDNIEEESEYEETQTVRGAELEMKATLSNISNDGQLSLLDRQEVSKTVQIWENERFVNRGKRSKIELPVDTVTPVSHRSENLYNDSVWHRP